MFTTTGTDSTNPKLQVGFKESLPEKIQESIKYFPFGGRMIFNNLKPIHKLFMKIGQRLEKDEKVKEEMLRDSDLINQNYIRPLLKYVNTLLNGGIQNKNF